MNYLLNVDYLEFRAISDILLNNSLSDSIYKISDVLTLIKEKDFKFKRPSYDFCFKVLLNKVPIALLWVKDDEYGFNTTLKIENQVLYVFDIGSILKTLVEALKLRNMSINRLDICYDTDIDVLSLFKFLYYDASTKFRLRNVIKVQGTGRDDEQIYIGSLSSKEKSVIIYNKTRHLHISNQEYIRRLHKKAIGIGNIYRVELRLYRKTKELKSIDMMKLNNKEYLETIFNSFFDRLVQFTDTITNSKIDFIVLNNNQVRLPLSKKPKFQSSSCKQIKAAINLLERECQKLGSTKIRRDWKSVCSVLLKEHGLEAWYDVKRAIK